MRWRIPRSSIRRLIILVAIAAVAVEFDIARRRAPYCRSYADRCTLAEKAHIRMAESHDRIAGIYRRLAANPRVSARYNNEQAAFYARFAMVERGKAAEAAAQREAFRNASRFPWLSLPTLEIDPLGSAIIDREEKLKNDGL